jgi:hypothetical protein
MLLLTIISLYSCRDSSERITQEWVPGSEKNFIVAVDVIVPEDDNLSLYYRLNAKDDYRQNKPIWKAVKGSGKIQEVVFTLPEKVIPLEIRLDFGNNEAQKDIYINRIKMIYNQNAFTAPGTLVFSYFRPDVRKTEFDAATGMIRGKIISGIRQSPSLYPKEKLLSKQIELLIKASQPK